MAVGDEALLPHMLTGLDRLLHDEKRLERLRSSRVALLANPASMTSVSLGFQHALDALVTKLGKAVTAAFGPQHGMRGDKQYNMEESPTYLDPGYHTPVFSLYGDVRRPTNEMLDSFDVLLFDLSRCRGDRNPRALPDGVHRLLTTDYAILLTVDEAADLLRTTRRAIYAMVERGQLPGVIRVRRRVLLRTDDLLHWLQQKCAPSPEE